MKLFFTAIYDEVGNLTKIALKLANGTQCQTSYVSTVVARAGESTLEIIAAIKRPIQGLVGYIPEEIPGEYGMYKIEYYRISCINEQDI